MSGNLQTCLFVVIFLIIYPAVIFFLRDSLFLSRPYFLPDLPRENLTVLENKIRIALNDVKLELEKNRQLLIKSQLRHYHHIEDARGLLDSLENNNLIYFIETSRVKFIRSRLLCSIEAATKHNPHSIIVLLTLTTKLLNPLLSMLMRQYTNIKVANINLNTYFNDTEFNDFAIKLNVTNNVHQISEIISVFTVWKYGGTYLDMDMILLKNIGSLYNFVAKENEKEVSMSVYNFQAKDATIYAALKEMHDNYENNRWPGLRFSKMMSNVTLTFPEFSFNAISARNHSLLFSEDDKLLAKLKDGIAVHFWHQYTWRRRIRFGSKQVLSVIAQENCPRLYWLRGSGF